MKQGLLTRNPATLAEVPRQIKSEVQALDEAQLRQVLAAARGYRAGRLHIPILLAARCTLRRGEVCALKWADVSFEEGTLAVRRSLETTAKGLQFKEPKAGHRRVIAMPALLVRELRWHKAAQAAHRLQIGALNRNDDLVVPNEDGTPLRPDTLTHGLDDGVRQVEVPKVSFHGLRHSAATVMLARGAGGKSFRAHWGTPPPP